MSLISKHLHLWGNKITDEGAQTLLETLQEENDTLLGLTLFGNPIKHDEILDVTILYCDIYNNFNRRLKKY